MEQEKVFANDMTNNGLIYKLNKQLIKLNIKKNTQTQLKNCNYIVTNLNGVETVKILGHSVVYLKLKWYCKLAFLQLHNKIQNVWAYEILLIYVNIKQ